MADFDALSAEVTTEIEAVQFTITEVGSDLVPTQTAFTVTHNGQLETILSDVGILRAACTLLVHAKTLQGDVRLIRSSGTRAQSRV